MIDAVKDMGAGLMNNPNLWIIVLILAVFMFLMYNMMSTSLTNILSCKSCSRHQDPQKTTATE